MWKWKKHHKQSNSDTTIHSLLETLQQSKDFTVYHNTGQTDCYILYIKTIIEPKFLHQSILPTLKNNALRDLDKIKNCLPVESIQITDDLENIRTKVMQGYIMIQLKESDERVLLIPAITEETRKVSIPEVEFSVVGPKEAFVESLDTNINLIRKRLPLPQLTIKELNIGKLTKTRVAIISIEGIANEENVNTVLQRLNILNTIK